MLSNNIPPQQSHPAKTLPSCGDQSARKLNSIGKVARGHSFFLHYFVTVVVVLGAIALGYFAALFTVNS